MCKETFLRLPEEKRNRFLEAAWEEFTRVKFADASINQIVRRAGVPRGSFYQYFDDKEDLFTYLVSMSRERFIQGFYATVEKAHGDLFAAMLSCFDRFQRRESEEPLVDRVIQLLHINLGMDMRKMMLHPSMDTWDTLLERIWSKLDLKKFARQDLDYIRQAVLLLLLVLAAAIMDSFACPERADEYRKRLQEQLEMVRCGIERRPCAAEA
ncbi:TetR/AcrR family transcriptional regulator [Dysosmobacter sp.]|jgi:AcrR family transcriptional regulator|uniref:TetR/AcrR family transcriptional regulator n=1 Tax=Dysosmobacter sp. TaxID=2591382 RepID=UPI003D8E62AF